MKSNILAAFAIFVVAILISSSVFVRTSSAQLTITGANHPELTWTEITTEHFVIVHHQGLDSIAREAARIAEEVYRVVTTNLHEPLPDRTRIYISDNDEVRNAFAFDDRFIFVWLRGILDDTPFSIRSSGTSKWLRTVITHEFTHIVIAHATRDWSDIFLPTSKVPRWFNEGLARYMEPDGWTSDLDLVLRVATVSGELNFNLDEYPGGVLMYEGGQSLVRYIAVNYGDSALVKIIHRKSGSYNFPKQVKEATGQSMGDIYEEWHKTLNVYYNTQFGQKEDIKEFARHIPTGLDIVGAARINPDNKRIAILGKRDPDAQTKLYLLSNDSDGSSTLLSDEPGIEPYLTWSPDGKTLAFSKLRIGSNGDLIHDLYRFDISTREMKRITDDSRYEEPDWSPKGDSLVAVRWRGIMSDLVLIPASGGEPRTLLTLPGEDAAIYWPRFSPNGTEVAFSTFDANGRRDVAIVTVATGALRMMTEDSINDRYAVWSPKGDSLMFVSHSNGIPNAYRIAASHTGASRSGLQQVSDVASNIMPWDWARDRDSVLVTSFKRKQSVQLYWIPASRIVKSAPPVALKPMYTSWRTVRFPLVTRSRDSVPPLVNGSETPYSSLAHISPLTVLPLVGTDVSRDGTDQDLRYGLLAVFSDEMTKHLLTTYVDYGFASKRPGFAVAYTNSQLRPTIGVEVSNLLAFSGVVLDHSYYEIDQTYGVGIALPLNAPDALNKGHLIGFGAQYRNLEPWNTANFDSLAQQRRPIKAKMLDLSIGYAYTEPTIQAGVSITHSDSKLGSDLSYTRYRLSMSYELNFDEEQHYSLAFLGRGMAQEGDELPQDFIGFAPYDVFEGGFNLTSLPIHDRLRGIRRYYYGDRMVLGSVELRAPGKLFTDLVPLLAAFRPLLVGFFDIGSVWYASHPTNYPIVVPISLGSTTWLKSAGIELSTGFTPNASIGVGVGWELVKNSKADLYLRARGVF